MSFPSQVKQQVLIRSARICCLCFKQGGVKIEVHHIIEAADGGPNTADNAIPTCFDCHAEVGHYNPRHPKGNKYGPEELKARRDALYALVESGVMQAQIVAQRAHATGDLPSPKLLVPVTSGPGRETENFLNMIVASKPSVASLARKVKLLDPAEAAWLLDQLLEQVAQNCVLAPALFSVLTAFDTHNQIVAVDSVLRKVTLGGDVAEKAAILDAFPSAMLKLGDEQLLAAFFAETLEIVRADQFDEVNVLVPPLVRHMDAVPDELHVEYVDAMLRQANSRSHHGAPAAESSLRSLPDPMASAWLASLDAKRIWAGHFRGKAFQEAVRKYAPFATGNAKTFIDDYIALGILQFGQKYDPDDQD